jgi:hypothetical protein
MHRTITCFSESRLYKSLNPSHNVCENALYYVKMQEMLYRFYKVFLLLTVFLGGAQLYSQIVQPQTTPQQEEAIVDACAKKPSAPLSEALFELIQGISDQTFEKDFFEKILALEKKKFTGEFVEHWENGQYKIKANFKDGKVDGHVHGWFSDGNEAFKGFFYENTKAGVHIAFYPKGAPRDSGKQKSLYYDGNLKTLVTFEHGISHGTRVLYNQNSKCIKDEFYEDGKMIPGKTTQKKVSCTLKKRKR